MKMVENAGVYGERNGMLVKCGGWKEGTENAEEDRLVQWWNRNEKGCDGGRGEWKFTATGITTRANQSPSSKLNPSPQCTARSTSDLGF